MNHLYANQNAQVAHKRRREISVAEINVLRKFEGRQMIEDRLARQMAKLHNLWFKQKPR